MHLKLGRNKEQSPKNSLESKFRIKARTEHHQIQKGQNSFNTKWETMCIQAGFPAVCIYKHVCMGIKAVYKQWMKTNLILLERLVPFSNMIL